MININKKQKSILLVSIVTTMLMFVCVMTNVIRTAPKAEAATSNGWNVPTWVKNDLNYFCSLSSTPMVAQSTWISAAGDPLRTEVTVARVGDRVALQYNVIVYRCVYNRSTGIYLSTFRTKGGYYDITGLPRQGIAGIDNIEKAVLTPTLTGDAYSFESVPFEVSSAGISYPGANILVGVSSKQLNWFTTNNILACIGNGRQLFPNNTIEDCPQVTPINSFRINVPGPPKRYNLAPSFSIDLNGGNVTFSVYNSGDGVSRQAGGAGVQIDRRIWKNGNTNNGPDYFRTNPSVVIDSNGTWPDSMPVPGGLAPGDTVCAQIGVNPASGETDGAADPGWRSAGGNGIDCVTFKTYPYFRAYGGDVVVGRQFENGGTCSSKQLADITGYTRSVSGQYAGAGSQFTASATGAIKNFLSAAMHNNVAGSPTIPVPGISLTFGNYAGSVVAQDGGGGDATGYAGCIPDYLQLAPTLGAKPWTDLSSIDATNDGYYIHEGDLTITHNITVSDSWGSLEAVPHFYLIVHGNINIAPGVTRLDGVYIAQSADPNKGIINTCAASGATWGQCRANTLTFNGSVIAKKLQLNRLKGDGSSASPNEAACPAGSPGCNIAEIFNYSAENVLGLPNASEEPSRTQPYDAIVGLPPVL